jgi:hypothetical protein
MQVVDLPGFRDFAHDQLRQNLAGDIERLNQGFMADPRNVMLCVEQAGDSATMATLSRCRKVDPFFRRTILIRNKLDKFYKDLTCDNVSKWVDGFGDLPSDLVRFALTLPWWPEDTECPGKFAQLRDEKSREDVREMEARQLSSKYVQTIGFGNFAVFLEGRIEQLFGEAVGPVLTHLKALTVSTEKKTADLQTEFGETDEHKMIGTMRECATLFAHALTPVMEGSLCLTAKRMTLEQELKEFHRYHQSLGSSHFSMLPSEDFTSLDDYINYLGSEIQIGAFDVEVNGGAMYRRMISEVEIFLRFSDISENMSKRDVIQARGVSMGSVTWRDVVVKLLGHEAHMPLRRRVQYVGERIKWFFMLQKEAIIEFMTKLEGTPSGRMYSTLLPKRAKLIQKNDIIKRCVFETYDKVCDRQLQQFCELFDNMLTSEFSNPWVFLRESDDPATLPSVSFDDVKARVPKDIQDRSRIEMKLSKWLQEFPTDEQQMDVVVDKVQHLMVQTYAFIRSQVCDQVELFAESFFKLPMMRRLEEDMSLITFSDEDGAHQQAHRTQLTGQIAKGKDMLVEINDCVRQLQSFAIKCRTAGA